MVKPELKANKVCNGSDGCKGKSPRATVYKSGKETQELERLQIQISLADFRFWTIFQRIPSFT